MKFSKVAVSFLVSALVSMGSSALAGKDKPVKNGKSDGVLSKFTLFEVIPATLSGYHRTERGRKSFIREDEMRYHGIRYDDDFVEEERLIFRFAGDSGRNIKEITIPVAKMAEVDEDANNFIGIAVRTEHSSFSKLGEAIEKIPDFVNFLGEFSVYKTWRHVDWMSLPSDEASKKAFVDLVKSCKEISAQLTQI